ncbi:MAG: polysaccharide deacetylase family protein [Flavisolibacter sp.]
MHQVLKDHNIKASFFFTGRFYKNKEFQQTIKQLRQSGHYLGAHSDEHLLYCDWNDRNRLLVSRDSFQKDLLNNYTAMEGFDVRRSEAPFFLPPFEWYNDSISQWTREMGLQLINFTPGTLSHADYTKPGDRNYRDSETIWNSIVKQEQKAGLNGFILLMHVGADPGRTDRFYYKLPSLIKWLKSKDYKLLRVDEMLKSAVSL